MAHFAQLDENNKVIQVIVVANAELLDETGQESETKGAKFCSDLFGGRWVQTSYNSTFRKNFAGPGATYNQEIDAFVFPSPYPSWILNTTTADWEPPVPMPTDGKLYQWNESQQKWSEPIWDQTLNAWILT